MEQIEKQVSCVVCEKKFDMVSFSNTKQVPVYPTSKNDKVSKYICAICLDSANKMRMEIKANLYEDTIPDYIVSEFKKLYNLNNATGVEIRKSILTHLDKSDDVHPNSDILENVTLSKLTTHVKYVKERNLIVGLNNEKRVVELVSLKKKSRRINEPVVRKKVATAKSPYPNKFNEEPEFTKRIPGGPKPIKSSWPTEKTSDYHVLCRGGLPSLGKKR